MAASGPMVWLRSRGALILWGFLGVVLIVLVLLAVFVIPDRLVAHDLAGQKPLESPALVKAINDVRTTLLQGVFGLLFLATAFFTYQQLKVSRDNRTTEQFTRAIEHLGSEQLDVRVGGIYALERIARASVEEHERRAVLEILSTYIREHAPRDRGNRTSARPSRLPRLRRQVRPPVAVAADPSQVIRLAADVQAGLLVLARRPREAQNPHIYLRGTNLSLANLAPPLVSVARLSRVNLQESVLQRANLEGANLRDGDLWAADLRWSNLQGANLSGAYLNDADLRGANLRKADLRDTQHTSIKLDGAEADAKTLWPTGLDPLAQGVIMDPSA